MATPRRAPQKPRGGNYANRRDLRQAPRAAEGQDFGLAKAQLDAQQAVPLANGLNVPAPTSAGPSLSQAAGALGGGGGQPVPLSAPTARPNEHFMTGVQSQSAQQQPIVSPDQQQDLNLLGGLRSMFQAHPNQDVANLISFLEARLDSGRTAPQRKPVPTIQPTVLAPQQQAPR